MKDIQSIQATLLRIEELLRIGGSHEWASGLEALRGEIANEPGSGPGKVLSLYGGMGSFNDIVLYRDGVLLVSENEALDKLRSELYELCSAG